MQLLLCAMLMLEGWCGAGARAAAAAAAAAAATTSAEPPVAQGPDTDDNAWDLTLHSLRSAWGHLRLLMRSRPVAEWIDDPRTPPAAVDRLQLAQALRRFAVQALDLPDGPSYSRYADLGQDAVVWNVVAAPALSLELRRWCFPVAGCVGYRGYFEEAAAADLEARLRAEGWEVLRYPVRAYSTLGRTDWLGGDPLLNTFAMGSPIELARLLFHELAHQKVYVPGDTAFNEAYATAVEELGLARWADHASASSVDPAQWTRWREGRARGRDWAALLEEHRAELQQLYAGPGDAAHKLRGKAELRQSLERRYRALRDGPWGGDARWDTAMASLNNAQLALHGSYHAGVPAFLRLFAEVGGDFPAFHAAVRRWAQVSDEQRRAWLRGADTP